MRGPPAALLLLAACALTWVACKAPAEKKAEDLAAANEKVCAKLEALAGGQTSPAQKDRCLAEIVAIGPNARACFDPCIERAKDKIDYETCKDECTSRSGLATTLCERAYAFDDVGKKACVASLLPLQTSDRAKLACVARCNAESESNGMDVCSKRCNAPVLPARKVPGQP